MFILKCVFLKHPKQKWTLYHFTRGWVWYLYIRLFFYFVTLPQLVSFSLNHDVEKLDQFLCRRFEVCGYCTITIVSSLNTVGRMIGASKDPWTTARSLWKSAIFVEKTAIAAHPVECTTPLCHFSVGILTAWSGKPNCIPWRSWRVLLIC